MPDVAVAKIKRPSGRPRPAHAFAHVFGAKWPKAVAKIVDDIEPVLAFNDFLAEHWVHLRTTNPIASAFPPCACGPG